MRHIAVIIPYYQIKPGILRRALQSVIEQSCFDTQNRRCDIFIIDDASPAPASFEIDGLKLPAHIKCHVERLPENQSPALARNTALEKILPQTDYIAFLDSDDIWHPNHLADSLKALDAGYDLYFCNHRRLGMHASYFKDCAPHLLDQARQDPHLGNHFFKIDPHTLFGHILRDFPTQSSTVVCKRDCLKDLRFEPKLKYAGEDLLFFSQLTLKAQAICISNSIDVTCGNGVNMYFSHFDWDDPILPYIAADRANAFYHLKSELDKGAKIPAPLKKELNNHVKRHDEEALFFTALSVLRQRGTLKPLETIRQRKRFFLLWLFKAFFSMGCRKLAGFLKAQ